VNRPANQCTVTSRKFGADTKLYPVTPITPRCCCVPYVTITPCICSGLGPLFIVFCSVRFLACLLHIFLPSLFMNTNYMNIDSVNTTLLSLLLNSFGSISRYPRIRPMFMIMNIFGGSHFEG